MNTPKQQAATWLAIYKLAKQLEDRRDGMTIKLPDDINERAIVYVRRIIELEAILEDVNEFLDGYVDVDDGDDGQPVANKAMRLQQEIQQVLAKAR